MLSANTKTLLTVGGVLLLIYLLCGDSRAPVSAQRSDDDNQVQAVSVAEARPEVSSQAQDVEGFGSVASAEEMSAEEVVVAPENQEQQYFEQRDYSPYLQKKFGGRNRSASGYKTVSYSGADRGNIGPSDWDEFFDRHNNIIADSQLGSNDGFTPVDETGNGFAAFNTKKRTPCGSNQNCDPEDLFDVDKYLPQEVNDDWFEVQPEPVSVKNRHLINVTKPIGINTIGTSLRNASYDIRGTPACPKFVVSPWLQSAIEPDTNLKPLM